MKPTTYGREHEGEEAADQRTWGERDNPMSPEELARHLGTPRIPCNDFAPDTLNPVAEDRTICTTCFFRAVDHAEPVQETSRVPTAYKGYRLTPSLTTDDVAISKDGYHIAWAPSVPAAEITIDALV